MTFTLLGAIIAMVCVVLSWFGLTHVADLVLLRVGEGAIAAGIILDSFPFRR